MKIKRGKYEIEIKTLRNQQRPSLLILADRNLHSKVGMMMDDQRAEEFMQYLAKMYGGADVETAVRIGESE